MRAVTLSDGVLNITDPINKNRKTLTRADRFIARFLRDERDITFVRHIFGLGLFIPAAVWLYLPGKFSWYIAVPYLVLDLVVFLAPFILMLHNTVHRPLFKREYNALNRVIPWLIGWFFGHPPDTYYSHHVGMHHVEDNLPKDLSSTMRFQRDSAFDFLRYFTHFFFLAFSELVVYHFRGGRRKLMRKTLIGELSFYALVAVLWQVNYQATLTVFVIPFLWCRFGMMAGNWAQHAFIDRETPDNNYRNSITCINGMYNRRCFNDGYHIGHHLKATRHFTELPQEFLDNRMEYARQKAIVFHTVDFFVVWFFLMIRSYKSLAKYFVQLDPAHPLSEEEIISLLKERTRKIDIRQFRYEKKGGAEPSEAALA